MLYDPKWEIKTNVSPASIEGLIGWLERQPAAATYNWHDCKGGCLIGLYGFAVGMGEDWQDFHYDLFKQGHLGIAGDKPHTFGAALDRARSALALHHSKCD